MYCPNCSAETPPNQKFCRSCGMSLQAVSRSISEHLSGTESDHSPDELAVEEKWKKFERWGRTITLSGLSILMLSIASFFFTVLLTKVFGVNTDFFINVILPGLLGIAIPISIVGGALNLYAKSAKELKGNQNNQSLPPAARPNAGVIEESSSTPRIKQIASITEHTTHKLELPTKNDPDARE